MVGLKKISYPMLRAMLVTWPLIGAATPAQAFETAPRISDREVIESLAELTAGQKALGQRFDGLEQRFDGLEKRFDGLRVEFKQDNQQLREELKQDNQQLREELRQDNQHLQTMLFQSFLAVLAMILGLIGFILWDRRDFVRPVKNQLDEVKRDLDEVKQGVERDLGEVKRDLELQHQGGPLLKRLVGAFREYAKSNGDLATILRSFSLL